MTSSTPKRASWPLAVALVLAGLLALGAGGFAAFAHLSRKEREVVATRALERDSKRLRERLEGGEPSFAAALNRLEAGEVSSSALAALVGGDVEDAAVVRLGTTRGAATIAWVHESEGKLAALFGPRPRGAEELAPRAAIMTKVEDLKRGVGHYSGVFAFDTVIVEDAALHREVVGVVYLASPSPVLLLVMVRQSASLPSAFGYAVSSLRGHDDE